jgi:hypothetical protein
VQKNKEANPLLLQRVHAMQAIGHSIHSRHLLRKQGGQILCSCKEQSHLLRKQGGLKWQKVTK